MRKPKAATGKAVRDGLASKWSSPGRTKVQGSVSVGGSAERLVVKWFAHMHIHLRAVRICHWDTEWDLCSIDPISRLHGPQEGNEQGSIHARINNHPPARLTSDRCGLRHPAGGGTVIRNVVASGDALLAAPLTILFALIVMVAGSRAAAVGPRQAWFSPREDAVADIAAGAALNE